MHIVLKPGQYITVECSGYKRVLTGDALGVLVGDEHDRAVERDDPAYVRISLGAHSYCYHNPDGAKMGDTVRIVLPNGRPKYATVLGLGRNGYTGRVDKSAELVPR